MPLHKGLAKLQVPRMPAFLSVGRQEHWLDMDPRAMSEWAPLAVTLGLTEALRAGRPGLPVRKLATDVMLENNSLPAKAVYVGRGSSHHRLSTTKWRSPWTPGHNCEAGEWPARYIVHIRTSPLWDALPELAGLTLVCDCPMDQLCEADIATTPESDPASRGSEGKWSRTVALLQGIQALLKRRSLAHDEPGSSGVIIPQAVPRALVPEQQVRHGGRLQQQPPILLILSLAG